MAHKLIIADHKLGNPFTPLNTTVLFMCVYTCMYIYIYIYMYTHTHQLHLVKNYCTTKRLRKPLRIRTYHRRDIKFYRNKSVYTRGDQLDELRQPHTSGDELKHPVIKITIYIYIYKYIYILFSYDPRSIH